MRKLLFLFAGIIVGFVALAAVGIAFGKVDDNDVMFLFSALITATSLFLLSREKPGKNSCSNLTTKP